MYYPCIIMNCYIVKYVAISKSVVNIYVNIMTKRQNAE